MNQDVQMILPKKELRISITSKCNMKCVYCHNEGNKRNAELNIEEIRNIVEAVSDYGLESVRLTGGEPLMHPEVEAICRMLSIDYGLKVGINTNGILIPKLIPLIQVGMVERVVVGIDFYDQKISKQSPVGIPSQAILENVLKVKDAGGNVCIDVVYQDNYENIADIVGWGIANKIRVKVIEEVNSEAQGTDNPGYEMMMQSILKQFDMSCTKDALGENNGYVGELRAVSFLHSLCRLHECETCRLHMPLRVTAGGILKPCIIGTEWDVDLYKTGLKNGFEWMLKNYSCRKCDDEAG